MTSQHTEQQPLGRVIRDDLRRGGHFTQMRREYGELKEFYLSEEQHARLRTASAVKGFFLTTWWLFKSLLLHMSSFRRILLLVTLVLLGLPRCEMHAQRLQTSTETGGAVIVVLLLLLMMEVKDKMLARSELQAGRVVQKALIPENPPQIPGWSVWLYYHPANDVGGDLLDYLPLSDKRHGLAIGDIADKGLGAALLMAKLQATLRALAPDTPNLAKLAFKTNQIYVRDTLANRFASLIYIEISPDSDKVRFVNAGHQPPFLIKSGIIEEWRKGNPALGIQAGIEFAADSIDLAPGDMLLFYSDGLVDARDWEGAFYGEERLRADLERYKIADAKLLGEKLIRRLQTFVGDSPTHDDITMILLQRTK